MTQIPTELSTEDLGPSITCYPSGARFYIKNPVFRTEDIAHQLGMVCRYNGAIRHFYSVAEHSVLVSLLMEELKLGDPMEGLMHDAHEAYMCDMVSPWKALVPDYKKLESEVEHEVREVFHLPSVTTHGCHVADSLALFIEGWYLKADRGADLTCKIDVRAQAMRLVDAGWRTMSLSHEEATAAWLKRYEQLRGR